MGTCSFPYASSPCSYLLPEDDRDASDSMGLIQGTIESWAILDDRTGGALPSPRSSIMMMLLLLQHVGMCCCRLHATAILQPASLWAHQRPASRRR